MPLLCWVTPNRSHPKSVANPVLPMACFYQISPLPGSTAQKGIHQDFSKPGARTEGWPCPKPCPPHPGCPIKLHYTGHWWPDGSPGYPNPGPWAGGRGIYVSTFYACWLTLKTLKQERGKGRAREQPPGEAALSQELPGTRPFFTPPL